MPHRVLACLLVLAAVACAPADTADTSDTSATADSLAAASDTTGSPDGRPYVIAASPEEAGRYLVRVAGCNDCHTPGWLQGEATPESQWLTGTSLGWQGPWGTTYPQNLRLTAARLTEDQWVEMLRTRTTLPPMPWQNLHEASERDLRAIYRYARTLRPTGEPAPASLPPGVEPTTPYLDIVPRGVGGAPSTPAAPMEVPAPDGGSAGGETPGVVD